MFARRSLTSPTGRYRAAAGSVSAVNCCRPAASTKVSCSPMVSVSSWAPALSAPIQAISRPTVSLEMFAAVSRLGMLMQMPPVRVDR